MARAVVWSLAAVADLDAAMEFVAEVSPSFTIGFVQEIREASRSLHTFADRGRIVPEVQTETLRELFVRDHRLIYRVGADEVTILAIFHGRRDFRRAWRGRPLL